MAYQKNDDYVEVADRIAQFKELYPKGTLQPVDPLNPYKVEQVGNDVLITYTAAAYRTEDDPRPGIGAASEVYPGKTPYTKGSELMNAETSAWGRAIVALGIPTKRIASANEVRNRQAEREEPKTAPKAKAAPKAAPAAPFDGPHITADQAIALSDIVTEKGRDLDTVTDQLIAKGFIPAGGGLLDMPEAVYEQVTRTIAGLKPKAA